MRIILVSIVIGPLMLLRTARRCRSVDLFLHAHPIGSRRRFDRPQGHHHQKARDAMRRMAVEAARLPVRRQGAKGQEEGNAAADELKAASATKAEAEQRKLETAERGRLGERQDLVREGIPRPEGGLGQNPSR